MKALIKIVRFKSVSLFLIKCLHVFFFRFFPLILTLCLGLLCLFYLNLLLVMDTGSLDSFYPELLNEVGFLHKVTPEWRDILGLFVVFLISTLICIMMFFRKLNGNNIKIKRLSCEAEVHIQKINSLDEKIKQYLFCLKEKNEQLEKKDALLDLTQKKLCMNEKLAALGELTAGIAHEINNPIAVILGNVELMKFGLGEHATSVQEEMTAVLEQIDRIRHITRSLLQYSRKGGVQDEVTWQYVNPVIEESVILVRSGTKKSKIAFFTDLRATVCVEINRHQLLQVLVNLQMNGIHAMNEEGTLKVKSEDWLDDQKHPLGVMISVQDFGCGISKENLNKIFSPFFTTRRFGSGLGLSVSQSIVRGLGGEIHVESTLGQGSTFTLLLREKVQSDLISPLYLIE